MKSQQTTVTTQETFWTKQIQYTRWQNTKEVELLYLLLTPRKWNRKYKREIIFCIIDQTEMRCRIVQANRKKTVCPYETIKQNTAWSAERQKIEMKKTNMNDDIDCYQSSGWTPDAKPIMMSSRHSCRPFWPSSRRPWHYCQWIEILSCDRTRTTNCYSAPSAVTQRHDHGFKKKFHLRHS